MLDIRFQMLNINLITMGLIDIVKTQAFKETKCN